jgi:catechol 2,3-dioxygenase-like lactoylglutathione lyase family enzyme
MLIHAITPILNVSDVPASVLWFERIGWRRSFAWNDGGMIEGGGLSDAHGPAGFAGVCAAWPGSGDACGSGGTSGSRGEQEEGRHAPAVFLCRDGQGSRDPRPCSNQDVESFGGVWMSWWVDDVDAAYARCLGAGVEVICPPADRPWGVRECLIRHPDGHYFRLSGHVAGSHDDVPGCEGGGGRSGGI